MTGWTPQQPNVVIGAYMCTWRINNLFVYFACMCMHLTCLSGFRASLAGKFGLADTFTGVLELSPMLCTCMRALCMPGQLSSPLTDDQAKSRSRVGMLNMRTDMHGL